MARPRLPKNVLEMRGSFKKNPKRKAGRESEIVVAAPLGEPPFNPEGNYGARLIEIWHEVVQQVPPGVLTGADRMFMETLCRLMWRARYSDKFRDYKTLEGMLGRIGMTPSGRANMSLPQGESKDDFEDFLQRKKRG